MHYSPFSHGDKSIDDTSKEANCLDLRKTMMPRDHFMEGSTFAEFCDDVNAIFGLERMAKLHNIGGSLE
jgi:hypothetical protein